MADNQAVADANDLSLHRLREVLNTLQQHSAEISQYSGGYMTLSADEAEKLKGKWTLHAFQRVEDSLLNAAALCEENGLGGDANKLREYAAMMVQNIRGLTVFMLGAVAVEQMEATFKLICLVAKIHDYARQLLESLQSFGAEGESIPAAITAALAGSSRAMPLLSLLWSHKGQFVDWDTIGATVWLNKKEEIQTMQKTVSRLNESLERVRGVDYRVRCSKQSGAQLYKQTKAGQS